MMRSTLPIRILVAEDDADDRMMIKDAFEESRLSNPVDFVEDGMQLMNYLQREGEYTSLADHPYPGFILLDLNMPRKDGRTALREIKASPILQRIPIVILTTSKAEEDIVRTYNLGVNSFICKPVTFDSLVEIVKTVGRYWIEIVAFAAGVPARRCLTQSGRGRKPVVEESREPVLHGPIVDEVCVQVGSCMLGIGHHEAMCPQHGPAVHGEPRHLRMELDAIGLAAIAECLVLEGIPGCQMNRARWQAQALAVPVIDMLGPRP